jgi:hypothetical protein
MKSVIGRHQSALLSFFINILIQALPAVTSNTMATMAAEVTSSPTQFHIPDLLAKWPFKRTLNPAYTTIKAQTEVWMQNFGAFDVESRKQFEKAIPDLLVSLTYPEAPLKELQLAADQMAIFFFIDDLSDACNTVQARALGDVIMDALR